MKKPGYHDVILVFDDRTRVLSVVVCCMCDRKHQGVTLHFGHIVHHMYRQFLVRIVYWYMWWRIPGVYMDT